jgi:hypothetical protein
MTEILDAFDEEEGVGDVLDIDPETGEVYDLAMMEGQDETPLLFDEEEDRGRP